MEEKPPIQRITMKNIAGHILAVFNLEKGLFYTIREMILRPGVAMQNYFYTEKRALFIKPLNFFCFWNPWTSIGEQLIIRIQGLLG